MTYRLPHVFLSKEFLASYEKRPVKWGFPSGPNSLGELTYRRTYSRQGEKFFQTVARNVEGLFEKIEEHCALNHVTFTREWAEATAQRMYEKIFTFKFTPPGRGFWMMGTDYVRERTGAGLFNCLKGSTKVLTRRGYVAIQELAGQEPYLMMKTGAWKKAPVSNFGKQKLYEIKLSHSYGYEKSLFATAEHGWFVRKTYDSPIERLTTDQLLKGMSLQQVFGQGCRTTAPSPQGIQAGLVYGDGTKCHGSGRIILCGTKNKELLKFFPLNSVHSYDYVCEGGGIVVDGLPSYFKDSPPLSEGRPYLLGWLMGYFAADGTVAENGLPTISSTSYRSLELFKEIAAIVGIGSFPIREYSRISNLTNKESILYSLTLVPETLFPEFFVIEEQRRRFSTRKAAKRAVSWKVVEVVDTGEEEDVFCATVEDYQSFVIEDHILTSNCAFVSTKNLSREGSKPFRFLMDVSMLGVGCGFDTRGAGAVSWRPCSPEHSYDLVVEDSREGWVESTGALIDWGLGLSPFPKIYYHLVRGPGHLIKGFGGISSGPEPLITLHKRLINLILSRGDRPLTSRDIVDIMNMMGVCVVAGNVRRTAELALGEANDEEYLDLKNYTRFPERAEYGWTSNNSIFATVGMSYRNAAERTKRNGEPGYFWLDNARHYGRMIDLPNYKDLEVDGANPCVEQSLVSYEMCNLVENYPEHHSTLAEYKETLFYSWLWGKGVSLFKTHWKETNDIMSRNLRIGSSMSGIAQFLSSRGVSDLVRWSDEGYREICSLDMALSRKWKVPESIKKTSIKPSGTVSLPAGATPGGHYPTYTLYIRRVRYAKNHPDLPAIIAAGYPVEDAKFDKGTVVVSFPIKGPPVKTEKEVSLREKVELAVLLQRYWADNQVSYTATFDPLTEGDLIEPLLKEFDKDLKAISFLPLTEEGAYEQMPYEAITDSEYFRLSAPLQKIQWPEGDAHDLEDRFCDGGACSITSSS